MKAKIAKIFLTKMIMQWQSTPQLSWQGEFRRRQLLKIFTIYRIMKRREKQKNQRRFWVRPIFNEVQRRLQGASDNLIREMQYIDMQKYIEYLRMDISTFHELLRLIGPQIEKQHVVRTPISTSTRLEICLRYLASGDSMSSISFAFRVGINTVSKIVSETCEAIWNILKEKVFPEITEDLWREKANEFETQWNFPNCIGAIDGRHMAIVAPPDSGSMYFNYKGTHSIVLLAITDANYCFTAVDIGAEGRRSDGGIFVESEIGRHLINNTFNLPPPKSIVENGPQLPFVLVGDEAFALTSFMMRPYPRANDLNLRQKVFNYRLSRARRIVECAFGIFTARWRIFRRPLSTNIDNAIAIVKATVSLHNFLMQKDLAVSAEKRQYMSLSPSDHVNVCRSAFQVLHCFDNTERNVIQSAVNIRDAFTEFFCTSGAIQQQWEKALHNDF